MNYTKIYNPSDKDVKNCFKGEDVSIGAGKTESFQREVATWLVTIYPFLETKEEKEATPAKVEKEAEKEKKTVKKKAKK